MRHFSCKFGRHFTNRRQKKKKKNLVKSFSDRSVHAKSWSPVNFSITCCAVSNNNYIQLCTMRGKKSKKIDKRNKNSSPFCKNSNLQKFQRVDRTTLKYFLQDPLQIVEKKSVFKSSKVTRYLKQSTKYLNSATIVYIRPAGGVESSYSPLR